MILQTSVTRLQAFRLCRRKTFLQDFWHLAPSPYNMLKSGQVVKMDIGTILHKIFEDSVDANYPTITDEQREFLHAEGYDIDKTCLKYLQDFAGRKESVIGKEQEYMIRIPMDTGDIVEVHARVDRLVKNAAGAYVVVDHKTTVSQGNTFANHESRTQYQLLDYATIVSQASEYKVSSGEVRVAKVYPLPIDIPRNQNGSLRRAVAGATYDDYIRAINKYDLRESDYTDVLEKLAAKEDAPCENYRFHFTEDMLQENMRQIKNSAVAFYNEFMKPPQHFMDVVGAHNNSCKSCLYEDLCLTGRTSDRNTSYEYAKLMYVQQKPEPR